MPPPLRSCFAARGAQTGSGTLGSAELFPQVQTLPLELLLSPVGCGAALTHPRVSRLTLQELTGPGHSLGFAVLAQMCSQPCVQWQVTPVNITLT